MSLFRKSLTLLGLVALVSPFSMAQTVDELVDKNLKARGGKDKITAVQSARYTGTLSTAMMDAPITLEWKRPGKIRFEFSVQGMTGIQAYDGAKAWQVMPFTGQTTPAEMPEDQGQNLKRRAVAFDGPLLDYADKGNQLEYLGEEEVEGSPAYKLKVTAKNGDVSYVYLDKDRFLQVKNVNSDGVEISIGDYRKVEGLLIAHKTEAQRAQGSQTIAFEKIELDVDLADNRFVMPDE